MIFCAQARDPAQAEKVEFEVRVIRSAVRVRAYFFCKAINITPGRHHNYSIVEEPDMIDFCSPSSRTTDGLVEVNLNKHIHHSNTSYNHVYIIVRR